MSHRLTSVLLLSLAATMYACASGAPPAGTDDATAAAVAAKGMAPPPESPLAAVKLGMSSSQVEKLLGEPDNESGYITGKSFIPFYYGPDTSRVDWMYRGMGRVVFSVSQYTGSLRVIRIDYNPDETARS